MKPPRTAPAGFPHIECQEDYQLERAGHTAAMMLETNPPKQVEAVTEYADETAGIPKEGFNGF